MPSDFTQIKDSGKCCCNCGVSSDQRALLRLNTYSIALACLDCWKKHIACANFGAGTDGKKCNHHPSDHKNHPCQHCGCTQYIHGLEGEFDRQYAASVGKAPTSKQCTGFGINTGACVNVVLAGPDGSISRLCSECERRWVQETQEGMKEISELLDFNPDRELPN